MCEIVCFILQSSFKFVQDYFPDICINFQNQLFAVSLSACEENLDRFYRLCEKSSKQCIVSHVLYFLCY